MHLRKLSTTAIIAGLLGSVGVSALTTASANDAERIKKLEDQVNALQKEVVVGGDIGGSFRVPGSETSLRVYGFAEMHMIQDLEAPNMNDYFTDIASQPLKSADKDKGLNRFTAETSRLGFESSTPTAVGSFTTKIEADFYASFPTTTNNVLRLRHAYGEYAGFLIGKTWSTWLDLDNGPETIDFNGPVGSPFSRRGVIRYTYDDKPNNLKYAVALEEPPTNAKTPTVVLRLDKSFEGGSVNVRAVRNELRTDDGKASKNGSGFGFGGNYKITDSDVLMAQYTAMKGEDGSYGYMIGGNARIKADATATTSSSVILDKSAGFIVGLAHTFSPSLRGTLAYSQTDMKESDEYLAAYGSGANKKLMQYHMNLIYSPIKNVELGVEYIAGERTLYADSTGSQDKGKLSRVDLMGRYSF